MKILLIMFGAVLLTNPLSNHWLIVGFEHLIFLISPFSPYVLGVFTLSVVFYLGMKYTEWNRVKLPKKSQTSKKSGMKYELSK